MRRRRCADLVRGPLARRVRKRYADLQVRKLNMLRAWRPAYLVFLTLLAVSPVIAAPPAVRSVTPSAESAQLFETGNELYRASDFEGAADHYRRILDAGVESAEVHYNYGNALYRLNRIGPAILQYEKAARLAPGDSDIEENLAFLKTLTADRTTGPSADASGFSLVDRALGFTSLDQDAVILCALWILLMGLIAAAIAARGWRARRLALWGACILLLPLLLAAGTLSWKTWRDANVQHGVVLAERVDVRSGPGDDHTSLFTVHEGLTVRVLRVQGSWAWISIDSGLNGWVPSDSFGAV